MLPSKRPPTALAMHPLLHLLMTQPGLLGEHAQAYFEMFASDAVALKQAGQSRLLWGVALLVCTIVGLVLAGVAVLLWAVTPAPAANALWVLAATPCVPLGAALVCLGVLRSPMPPAFAQTKEQVQADMHMIKEFGG